ncbi:hypothetical protein SAMN05660489_05750 [Pseudomonas sp. LAMO17WK12:I10]|nr:hypothetical protein H160_05745 [Pseudomonas sp. LAMO17WK12:I9]SNY51674.1 hypothetical protein SAMN05660489_05750 [Pseudomonas sp. LAMO17WK12:I10]
MDGQQSMLPVPQGLLGLGWAATAEMAKVLNTGL